MRSRYRRGWLVPLALAGGVAFTACDDETAPPFEVEGTGSMEGLVFFDADEDGIYTPTAGDSVLPGVSLLIRERATELTFSGASVTTGANGRFLVEGLPLGTHDLMVDTTTVPGNIRFCQNPQPVTVYRNETTYEPVDGKSSCLVTIAEAEALAPAFPGTEYVTVAGVVTAAPGQINSSGWIQDESGGIRIDGIAAAGVAVGDYIEVSGGAQKSFETMIVQNAVVKEHVEDYGEADPDSVTTDSIADFGGVATSFIQGRLVKVYAAEVVVEFGGGGINERNAKINDGSGQTELRIYDGLVSDDDVTTLNTTYPVGTCYDITGIVGEFGAIGQVYPRTLDDIVEVPCP